MHHVVGFSVLLLTALLVHIKLGASAEPPSPSAQEEFFLKKVRPILVANCFQCHGEEKHEGGLRLDSREAMLQGGDSGPAIVPGNADDSLVVDAIRYGQNFQMPPENKLKDEQIEAIADWVLMGAAWPKQKK